MESFATTSEKELCLHILKEEFGTKVKDVAHHLLNSEAISLISLIKKISAEDEDQSLESIALTVRHALLKLLQHNMLIITPMIVETKQPILHYNVRDFYLPIHIIHIYIFS